MVFKKYVKLQGQEAKNYGTHVKGLVTRKTHMQYESPISSGKKGMAKVKVFQKKVKFQGQGKKLRFQVKGLVTRNIHVQYETPNSLMGTQLLLQHSACCC